MSSDAIGFCVIPPSGKFIFGLKMRMPQKGTKLLDTDLHEINTVFGQSSVLGERSSQSELFQNATPSTTMLTPLSFRL
jgi:hypothetical protein